MPEMPPTDPLAHHLFAMACNNAWANLRLLGAIGSLDAESFHAPRQGFFRTLHATANHVITVDAFYLDALERAFDGRGPHERPGVFFEPEHPHDDASTLIAAQREMDQRLIALCRARSDAELASAEVRIERRWGLAKDTAPRILAHLFQHQIHHRGQMHAMLSSSAVAPPQLDEFFCAGEAGQRVDALAELGLSEDAIWG